jgi:hypothetical protein
MAPRYDYRIGAGWNLPLGSLTNIENIKPTGDVNFYPPRSFGTYNPGQYRIRGDGQVYTAGFPTLDWPWFGNPEGRLTPAQAYKLSTDYCNGGQSGKVTIYSKQKQSNIYLRSNAVMILSPYPESGVNFGNFGRFVAHMTRLVNL